MIDRLLKVKCFNYQVNNKDFCNYESLELKKKHLFTWSKKKINFKRIIEE